jgi:RNA polymerase sigma-70 factor (ECF subfamily)
MSGNSIALGQDVTHDSTFDVLFNVHHEYVYRLAHALLGHAQDAEDVTQEVFLRVYKGLPGYQADRASLRTWITQVVVNTCQRQRRRNFVRRLWYSPPPSADDGESLDLADSSAWGAPEGQVLQAELRRTVHEMLDRLRPEHRTILILHYYMDLSCPEIARALNCAEGTVYSRLHYARRRLQTELEARPLAQQKVKS